MTKILYVVPYFGTLPDMFPIWLHSCKNNPSINWLIFTDDHRDFDYPDNVAVIYTSFQDIKHRFERLFSYEINLERPYKLCDYKVCYGLAFQDYIQGYDFWGFCDIDLIWGNIRHILTDDILSRYDKIGYQGHSTLFRNSDKMNNLFYKSIGDESIKDKLQAAVAGFTDEDFINRLCDYWGIPYYQEKTFANLSSFVHNFKLNHLERKDRAKNKHFIFSYEKGQLFRLAVVGNKIYKDEFMYVHFLKRNMRINIPEESDVYLIIPNQLIPPYAVDAKYIKKANAAHTLRFFIQHFKENVYKLNYKTIIPIFVTKIKGYFKLYTRY